MKKSISKLLILLSAIILSGCAASYSPINPPTVDYNSHDMQDGVGLSYKYDVLRERGNRKYAKKETKKEVKLIAVKVTNNTDSVITIGRNIAFYTGQSQIFPMEPIEIKKSIKQIVPGYLPFLFLTFLQLNVSQGTSFSSFPIGVVIGPGLTIGNMTLAGSANKNLLYELNEYNILNIDIQKGMTVYGIIGVRDIGYSPITVKMK